METLKIAAGTDHKLTFQLGIQWILDFEQFVKTAGAKKPIQYLLFMMNDKWLSARELEHGQQTTLFPCSR